jgi:hypothetical protein
MFQYLTNFDEFFLMTEQLKSLKKTQDTIIAYLNNITKKVL